MNIKPNFVPYLKAGVIYVESSELGHTKNA